MHKIKRFLFLLLGFSTWNCKELYNAPVKDPDNSFLVVDGNLNNGTGPTTIRLTRTNKLDNKNIIPELMAQLTIEGKDNSNFSLSESGNGYYFISQLQLNSGEQYRLRIKTQSGKEYLSDYITAKDNPPIDSISWKLNRDGVTIYANTHDPLNNTRYYRWEYDETWEIHTHFTAKIKYVNGSIIDIPPDQYVNVCWKYANSTNILLGSSEKLSSDIIFENPLIQIPTRSERLSVRYSILVRQYALSKEAFLYYQVMRKNTESLGSVFDALPAEVPGNLHSISVPDERVIGFLTISPVREQRIFISNNELPDWGYMQVCGSQLIPNTPTDLATYIPSSGLPYDKESSGIAITGYYISDPQCVDCTYMGGFLARPSYW